MAVLRAPSTVLWDSSAAHSHGSHNRTQSSVFMRRGYCAVSHTFLARRMNTMPNTRLQTTSQWKTSVQDCKPDSSAVFECHEYTVASYCSYRVSHKAYNYRRAADKCKNEKISIHDYSSLLGIRRRVTGWRSPAFRKIYCLRLQESSSLRRTAVILVGTV